MIVQRTHLWYPHPWQGIPPLSLCDHDLASIEQHMYSVTKKLDYFINIKIASSILKWSSFYEQKRMLKFQTSRDNDEGLVEVDHGQSRLDGQVKRSRLVKCGCGLQSNIKKARPFLFSYYFSVLLRTK